MLCITLLDSFSIKVIADGMIVFSGHQVNQNRWMQFWDIHPYRGRMLLSVCLFSTRVSETSKRGKVAQVCKSVCACICVRVRLRLRLRVRVAQQQPYPFVSLMKEILPCHTKTCFYYSFTAIFFFLYDNINKFSIECPHATRFWSNFRSFRHYSLFWNPLESLV